MSDKEMIIRLTKIAKSLENTVGKIESLEIRVRAVEAEIERAMRLIQYKL